MTYKYYIKLLLLFNLCHHVLCFKILTKHSCNNHGKLTHTGTSLRVHSCAGLRGTLCADMSHACSATCANRKHVKNNNSTPMIIPTFSPFTSIFVNSLKQHAHSKPLTDVTPSSKSPWLFHCFVNVFSGRPCQHSWDNGEGFPFVLRISMKELVRRQSDCITPGKGQNILIHTFNWFCSSGWRWSCYSWPFKYFLWRNVKGRGKNSGCNVWLVLVYSHRLDYSSFS